MREKELAVRMHMTQWGGLRLGSGRINRSGTVNHMTRTKITLKNPLHLTLKLKSKLPTLRQRTLFKEFKKSIHNAQRFGLYVIHFSIQYNHIHLIAEAKSNDAIARGMRSFAGRFAKIIRKYTHKIGYGPNKGSVFKGRYHLHVLRTSLEVKNALKYVLLNTSKHTGLIEHIDEYSSAPYFMQWKKLIGTKFTAMIREEVEQWFYPKYERDRRRRQTPQSSFAECENWYLSKPKSYLANVGWMRVA